MPGYKERDSLQEVKTQHSPAMALCDTAQRMTCKWGMRHGGCTCDMVSQWSKTAWGKACPEVAARSVEVNPKDSMTGRYAFRLKIGVPAPTSLFVRLQQIQNVQQGREQTESAGTSCARRQGYEKVEKDRRPHQKAALSTCTKLLERQCFCLLQLTLHQALQASSMHSRQRSLRI